MPRSLRVGGRSSKQKPKHARRLFVSVDEAANRSRDSEVAAVFFAAAFCFVFFEPKETQPRMARQRRHTREEDQEDQPKSQQESHKAGGTAEPAGRCVL